MFLLFVFLLILSYLGTFCFSFSFSLARRISDPRSLSRRFLPLPTAVRALIIFVATRVHSFPSLVDSHRIAPTHAAGRFQQLTCLILFLRMSSKVRPTWEMNFKTLDRRIERYSLYSQIGVGSFSNSKRSPVQCFFSVRTETPRYRPPLGHARSSWSVKTGRPPSRHCGVARV